MSDYPAAVGLGLPAAFVFAVSVFGEWGENMRFKFFLEPVLFVFIVAQGYAACAALAGGLTTRRARGEDR